MTKQCRWRPWRVLAAAAFLSMVAACAATAPPPAADAYSPPWLLRHTFLGWDGKPIEVLGAPGPRAVAAFLSLAMRREQVSKPQELGELLGELPSFYSYSMTVADDPPFASRNRWHVRSDATNPPVEWEGDDSALLEQRHPKQLLERLSLRELAVAMSDVVWKWPRTPGSRTFMRPPLRINVVGSFWGRQLREKLDLGMPLERAWQELQFENFDDIYLVSLLPGGLLRVSWHPEMDPSDWPIPPPWEGKY